MVADFEYTPDAVLNRRGHLICIECKPKRDADMPEIQAKHAAVKFRLSQVGVDFLVVTDIDLACEASRLNSRDLVRGLRTPLSRDAETAVRRQIADIQPASFGVLVNLIGRDHALVALARGMTFFDTHHRLTLSTTLGPFQEHFDAANFIFR